MLVFIQYFRHSFFIYPIFIEHLLCITDREYNASPRQRQKGEIDNETIGIQNDNLEVEEVANDVRAEKKVNKSRFKTKESFLE